MSWIERTTKKRIDELDQHPELNSNDFEEKGNNIMKDIKFYVIVILAAVLVLALWYQWNHPEIDIFPFHFPILVVTRLDSYKLLPIKVKHLSKESNSPFSLLYPDCKISPVVIILKLSCLANSSNSKYCSRDT